MSIKSILVLLILIIGIVSSGCTTKEDDSNIETEYTHKIINIDAKWQNGLDSQRYRVTYLDENNVPRRVQILAYGNYNHNTTIIISNESKLTIKYTPKKEYVIYISEKDLIELSNT